MTMTVTEHQITTERKEHPNDGRYPCRSSQEVLAAGMKLINILSPEQLVLLKENNLILDADETAELYDEFKVGDIIGLGILRTGDYYLGTGFSAHKFEVTKIVEGEDYLLCKNLRSNQEEEISFQDVSAGFAMGFAEILYRDEKPFGISAEQTITLKIHHDPDEEKNETAEPKVSEEVEQTVSDTEESGNVEICDKSSSEDEIAPLVQTIEEESISQALSFKEYYFAFGRQGGEGTFEAMDYIVITPQKLWDENKEVCDQSVASSAAMEVGLSEIMESTFEWDESETTKEALRDKLTALGALEKPEILEEHFMND